MQHVRFPLCLSVLAFYCDTSIICLGFMKAVRLGANLQDVPVLTGSSLIPLVVSAQSLCWSVLKFVFHFKFGLKCLFKIYADFICMCPLINTIPCGALLENQIIYWDI